MARTITNTGKRRGKEIGQLYAAGFDLPDCYRALKAKDLRLLEPLHATGRT